MIWEEVGLFGAASSVTGFRGKKYYSRLVSWRNEVLKNSWSLMMEARYAMERIPSSIVPFPPSPGRLPH